MYTRATCQPPEHGQQRAYAASNNQPFKKTSATINSRQADGQSRDALPCVLKKLH